MSGRREPRALSLRDIVVLCQEICRLARVVEPWRRGSKGRSESEEGLRRVPEGVTSSDLPLIRAHYAVQSRLPEPIPSVLM